MTGQLELVPAPADPLHRLTGRQRLAYDYILAHDGVSADEVGAFLHAHRDHRPHGVGERCQWCAKDGLGVLRSKGVAPLVTYRRHREGRLYIAKTDGKPAAPSAQATVLPGSSFEDIFGGAA